MSFAGLPLCIICQFVNTAKMLNILHQHEKNFRFGNRRYKKAGKISSVAVVLIFNGYPAAMGESWAGIMNFGCEVVSYYKISKNIVTRQ